jgi:RNA polymerase sigma-B factor
VTSKRRATLGPSHAERALFARLARDRNGVARDALVVRFLPLARQLARRYRNGEDGEDLEQVAAIGLLKAIDRFDPERGLAFSTFAVPTIVGELKRHLRDRGWSVHVPRPLQELAARVERISVDLVTELGRAPTVTELAARTGAPRRHVLDALQATTARSAVSLDQPWPDGGDESRIARELATTDSGFATVEDAEQLHALLGKLSARDRLILELRFRDDHSQTHIADLVGLTQMQVSRLIRRTIDQLQREAGASPAPELRRARAA